MKPRIFIGLFVLLSTIPLSASQSQPRPLAEWTIMVFMNADNNLERDAICNFKQMAEVGSTDQVNIVVQFDRPPEHIEHTTPDWSQTLRFHVSRGMESIPKFASQDIGEANMGDPNVLSDFIKWSKHEFPAQHYFLIIWDHGQGYRLLTKGNIAAAEGKILKPQPAPDYSTPYRSISHDETSNDKLYNIEIQKALADAIGNEKLDIIGFDACLMAMVETGYALRNYGKIMVGSEEVEPGPGWNYETWLRQLRVQPEMSANDLSKLLINSYEQNYSANDLTTTLSAVDLSKMESLASAISVLAETLRARLNSEKSIVRLTRDRCREYYPNNNIYHIDLGHFLDQLLVATHDSEISTEAQNTRSVLSSAVIARYAGYARLGDWGSTGLAIYFPKTKDLYDSDSYAENGYEKNNTFMPVEFVQKQKWGDFLHSYWDAIRK